MNNTTSEFVSLWTRYQPEVRRYVSLFVRPAVDVEDVMQQTAACLWSKFAQYDRDRPFVAWAMRFAYHEVLSWRQRQARDRLVFSDELIAQLHATIAEESPLLEVRRRALDGCLRKLSVEERGLLLRRYSEHGAVQEEARRTRKSPHKLYYTIDKLRVQLLACIDGTLRLEGWQYG